MDGSACGLNQLDTRLSTSDSPASLNVTQTHLDTSQKKTLLPDTHYLFLSGPRVLSPSTLGTNKRSHDMNQQKMDGTVLGRREVPKLGNSTAGFIVLIVVLCLIITTSIIGIYFLLRKEKVSDAERAKRRKQPGKARYGFPADDTRLPQKLWHLGKHHRFFSSRTDQIPEGLPVQSVDDLQPQAPPPTQINRMTPPPPNKRGSILTVSTSYGSNIRSLASPTSLSSVRFDTTGVRVNLPPERDRFAPSPMTPPPNIHAYLSTPPPSAPSSPAIAPKRFSSNVSGSISLAPSFTQSIQHDRDITLHSMSSSPLPTTFEGGSRFLETFQ